MIDVLVVDDDLGEFAPGLSQALKGSRLHFAYSGREALDLLAQRPEIQVALLDIKMPPDFAEVESREGIEVLKHLRAQRPEMPVIMLSALADIDLVVEAVQAGAFHYITKPPDRDKLRDAVERATENLRLKEQVDALSRGRDALLRVHGSAPGRARQRFHGIVGAHPLMRQLFDHIERVASFADMSVILFGETGAGKDLVARAIHESSPLRGKPFVAVNCAALPENVLEDELFGHRKGAFTGAEEDRDGLFIAAGGGTVFLDEVGDMSPKLQAAVLRVLETKELKPIGSDRVVRTEFRLICATHRDLVALKQEGGFREDLYYRIVDIPLTVPPLRARLDDIPLLVEHFLRDCEAQNRIQCRAEPGAVRALAAHDWPGNVRELRSVVRRLVVMSGEGLIRESDVRCLLSLPAGAEEGLPCGLPGEPCSSRRDVQEDAHTEGTPVAAPVGEPAPGEFPEIVDLAEYRRIHGEVRLKEVLERALRETGNAKRAMALLGMPGDRYDAFRKWLQRMGLRVRKPE